MISRVCFTLNSSLSPYAANSYSLRIVDIPSFSRLSYSIWSSLVAIFLSQIIYEFVEFSTKQVNHWEDWFFTTVEQAIYAPWKQLSCPSPLTNGSLDTPQTKPTITHNRSLKQLILLVIDVELVLAAVATVLLGLVAPVTVVASHTVVAFAGMVTVPRTETLPVVRPKTFAPNSCGNHIALGGGDHILLCSKGVGSSSGISFVGDGEVDESGNEGEG